MVQHGRSIRCPFGRPIKKRPPKTLSRAAQELDAMEAAEATWGDQRCDRLNAALQGRKPSQHSAPPADINVDLDRIEYEPPLQDPSALDPDTPAAVDTHQQLIYSSQYKKRRLREEENWRNIRSPMFRAYMVCAHQTSDWSNPTTWNEDRNEVCSCTPSRRRVRSLDVVDILCKSNHLSKISEIVKYRLMASTVYVARGKLEVGFCACQPDQVRLIRMGYIGGSPIHPNTAFSLRLIRFHHMIWKHCSIRFQPFAYALDAFLDPHNPMILGKGSTKVNYAF